MYIAIDAGGTNIRIAKFDLLESTHYSNIVSFRNLDDYPKDIRQIIDHIKSFNEPVEKICIGVAGVINKGRLGLIHATHMRSWERKPLVNTLSKEFNCSVLLENDATIAAIGEACFGKQDQKDFMFLIWGTGVGGAMIRYVKGEMIVYPSEFGHQIIDWDGRLCSCDQKGCLDAYCGGASLKKIYHKEPKDLKAKDWNMPVEMMTNGIINLVAITNIKKIIFGGSVGIKQPQVRKLIEEELKKKLSIQKQPKFYISELRDEAGIYGAFAIMRNS